MGMARAPKLLVPSPFGVRPPNGHTETPKKNVRFELRDGHPSGYSKHWIFVIISGNNFNGLYGFLPWHQCGSWIMPEARY